MRALVHVGAGRLELRNLPEVSSGDRGGVLKVEGSSACIADSETLHGYGPAMLTPMVLGHEIVGRIGAVGADAPAELKRLHGSRVLIDDARPCGECEWCRRDQKRFCKQARYGHIVLEESTTNWGGYAEAVTLDRQSVMVPVPEDLPIEIATYAFPVASGVEWLCIGAALRPGESVAILGTSRMAVASALVALHEGVSSVVIYGDRRGVDAIELAIAMGVEVRDFPATPKSAGQYDVVVVVTEAPVEYVAASVEMAGPLGRVILACTSAKPSGIEPETIRRKGLTIKGGRGASAQALSKAVAIVDAERDRLSTLVGKVHGFDAAERVLTGLLDSGVAKGTHVVIADTGSRKGKGDA